MFKYFLCSVLLIVTGLSQADELLDAANIQTNAEGITISVIEDKPTWTDKAQKAQEVLMHALSLTGIQYKYGGSSPDTGFDCSGFVRYVFSQAAKITLPPTARAISQIGKTVKKEELQPGDLVFFNTLKTAFSHVGIYIGNNKFVHAPRTGTTVRVENMDNAYWTKHFNGAKRLDKELEIAQ